MASERRTLRAARFMHSLLNVFRVHEAAGKHPRRFEYTLSRWLFLRLLGVVYLIAFASLGVQVIGLIGRDGILPAADYLSRAHAAYGGRAYHIFPTLLWINASDAALTALCWGGVGLSVLLIVDVAPVPVLVLLWATYLSLSVVGQDFLSFQWDALLLEAGFLAIFFAPARWVPRFGGDRNASAIIRWLIWFLLFKLLFLSGITKILSGDPTWRNLTALSYHYETQPLPTWIGWYAYHLPLWFQKLSAIGMFAVELAAPVVLLLPLATPWPRRIACVAIILFQKMIGLTGNYGFFNLLTIALALSLLDDEALGWLVPNALKARWRAAPVVRPAGVAGAPADAARRGGGVVDAGATTHDPPPTTHDSGARGWGSRRHAFDVGVGIVVGTMSVIAFVREMAATVPGARGAVLQWTDNALGLVAPFRTVNGYGLFRVMTTKRPEIILEGSDDDSTWSPIDFRWKPGPLDRKPRFVEPHMPRLDWQMWFAALNPNSARGWLVPFLYRVLEGSPAVRNLLAPGPFANAPPKYVRLEYYEYEFTSFAERDATGNWWTREKIGDLTKAVSLEDFRGAR